VKEKNPHAVELGRLGGKARLRTMSKEERKRLATVAGEANKARLEKLKAIRTS
jgi:hypothetical protein